MLSLPGSTVAFTAKAAETGVEALPARTSRPQS